MRIEELKINQTTFESACECNAAGVKAWHSEQVKERGSSTSRQHVHEDSARCHGLLS